MICLFVCLLDVLCKRYYVINIRTLAIQLLSSDRFMKILWFIFFEIVLKLDTIMVSNIVITFMIFFVPFLHIWYPRCNMLFVMFSFTMSSLHFWLSFSKYYLYSSSYTCMTSLYSKYVWSPTLLKKSC